MNIVVLVLPQSTLLTLASVFDPLRATNRLSSKPVFSWEVVSPDGQSVSLAGGFELAVDGAFDDAPSADLLIVVASFDHEKYGDAKLIRSLQRKFSQYGIFCGVESGTWLLARAAIAKDHKVTTHWEDLEDLATRFPQLQVVRNRFLKEGRIWSCGGASPAFDMMLSLIGEVAGASLALNVASVFIYDQNRAGHEEQPSLSLGRLEGIEPRIVEAMRLMERTIDRPLTTFKIAKTIGLSVKMFEVLWRNHLGETPGRYYLNLRLQAARKLVLDTKLPLQEIAIRTGFSSQSAFSRSFKNRFGFSPLQLRRREQRGLAETTDMKVAR